MLHKTASDLTSRPNNVGAGDRLRAIIAKQVGVLRRAGYQINPAIPDERPTRPKLRTF